LLHFAFWWLRRELIRLALREDSDLAVESGERAFEWIFDPEAALIRRAAPAVGGGKCVYAASGGIFFPRESVSPESSLRELGILFSSFLPFELGGSQNDLLVIG